MTRNEVYRIRTGQRLQPTSPQRTSGREARREYALIAVLEERHPALPLHRPQMVATDTRPLNLTIEVVWAGVIQLPLPDRGALSRTLADITALWHPGLLVRQFGPHKVNDFARRVLSRITLRQIDQSLVQSGLKFLANLAPLPAIHCRELLNANGYDDGVLRTRINEQAEGSGRNRPAGRFARRLRPVPHLVVWPVASASPKSLGRVAPCHHQKRLQTKG